jgi:predicted Fe-S protein YdhL (DUF1289 family)
MIKSPCTNICAIDPKIDLCVGCKRTIKEITSWFNLSNMEKKKILLKIQDRKFFISNNQKKYQKLKY